MKLTITERALEKLNRQLPDNRRTLLSLDDGVGPFSKVGICSLEISFDVIAVDPGTETPDYDATLSTTIGNWQYKGYSGAYLNDHMKLDVKKNQLVLSGDSGILDSNVDVKDLTKQAV